MTEDIASKRQSLRPVGPEFEKKQVERAQKLRTRAGVQRTKSVEKIERLFGAARQGLRKAKRPEKTSPKTDHNKEPVIKVALRHRELPKKDKHVVEWEEKHQSSAVHTWRPTLTRRQSESDVANFLERARRNLRPAKLPLYPSKSKAGPNQSSPGLYEPKAPWEMFVKLRKTNFNRAPPVSSENGGELGNSLTSLRKTDPKAFEEAAQNIQGLILKKTDFSRDASNVDGGFEYSPVALRSSSRVARRQSYPKNPFNHVQLRKVPRYGQRQDDEDNGVMVLQKAARQAHYEDQDLPPWFVHLRKTKRNEKSTDKNMALPDVQLKKAVANERNIGSSSMPEVDLRKTTRNEKNVGDASLPVVQLRKHVNGEDDDPSRSKMQLKPLAEGEAYHETDAMSPERGDTDKMPVWEATGDSAGAEGIEERSATVEEMVQDEPTLTTESESTEDFEEASTEEDEDSEDSKSGEEEEESPEHRDKSETGSGDDENPLRKLREQSRDDFMKYIEDDMDSSKRRAGKIEQRLSMVHCRDIKPEEKPKVSASAKKFRDMIMWYNRLGDPNKETMKRKVKNLPRDCDITEEDIDTLPWMCHGRFINIAALNKMIIQGEQEISG